MEMLKTIDCMNTLLGETLAQMKMWKTNNKQVNTLYGETLAQMKMWKTNNKQVNTL